MKWIDKLTKENPCPEAWQDKGENGYPRSELGYFRCDYDGYRWWNTVWPINGGLAEPELVQEFDAVYDAFLKAFPTREAMRKYCITLAETADERGEGFNRATLAEASYAKAYREKHRRHCRESYARKKAKEAEARRAAGIPEPEPKPVLTEEEKREKRNARALAYYHTHKAELNAKRKAKREAAKAAK